MKEIEEIKYASKRVRGYVRHVFHETGEDHDAEGIYWGQAPIAMHIVHHEIDLTLCPHASV